MKIGSKTYDVLKNVAQIYLPGLGTLYFALAQIWHLPAAEEVTGTVIAVDTFLGLLLGISSASYAARGDQFGGTLAIHENEQGSYLKLEGVDAKALENDSITFKITHPTVS